MGKALALPDPDDGRPAAASAGQRDELSFEHHLDDEPDDGQLVPVHDSAGFPLPAPAAERRAVVPEHLRTADGIRKAIGRRCDTLAYNCCYYGLRAPWYLAQTAGWAAWGLVVVLDRQRRWWWCSEQSLLRSAAVIAGDSREWMTLHNHARNVRRDRGMVLGAELFAVVLGADVLALYGPWWSWPAVAAAAVPPLARAGLPAGKTIITPSMVTPRVRVLSADIVLRALYRAKLGDPARPDEQITFGSPMSRDGDGSRVAVDLPYGSTFAEAMRVRAKIASGLDVKVQQVYLQEDPTSERRLVLWVADRDPLAVPAGQTPLLDCKPRSIWKAAPLGLDERGRKVLLELLWNSFLIGAQPRKGKTFAARLLALYAALDPWVRITIADGKASPDWQSFRHVAHRMISGVQATRDGDPVRQLIAALEEIKAHIEGVNEFLKTLPVTECPEGKNTEALSRKYEQLRIWVLVMEEFQVYFETDDQKLNHKIAKLLGYILAVGPSAGVILISSSQKPGGVGAGDVGRLFTRFRDNHGVRFALKCGNRIVSDAILGGDAYSEGFDASALPSGKRYRGVGILYGASDETPTVRTHLADGQDAEVILLAARALREKHGTLTGDAADEDMAAPERDVLADVLAVFGTDNGLHWGVLAERLEAAYPGRWGGITAEAVSAQVRSLGVPGADVRYPSTRTGKVRAGCRRSDAEAVASLDAVA